MIKRTKRPNRYSLKQIAKINAEVPERIKLIKRCGGQPRYYTECGTRNDGTRYEIGRVLCVGGICECGCGRPGTPYNGGLHPHEKHSRGRGGIVSEENSIMVLNECHDKLQKRSPLLKWIR